MGRSEEGPDLALQNVSVGEYRGLSPSRAELELERTTYHTARGSPDSEVFDPDVARTVKQRGLSVYVKLLDATFSSGLRHDLEIAGLVARVPEAHGGHRMNFRPPLDVDIVVTFFQAIAAGIAADAIASYILGPLRWKRRLEARFNLRSGGRVLTVELSGTPYHVAALTKDIVSLFDRAKRERGGRRMAAPKRVVTLSADSPAVRRADRDRQR
jgi:hypothetical protein